MLLEMKKAHAKSIFSVNFIIFSLIVVLLLCFSISHHQSYLGHLLANLIPMLSVRDA